METATATTTTTTNTTEGRALAALVCWHGGTLDWNGLEAELAKTGLSRERLGELSRQAATLLQNG